MTGYGIGGFSVFTCTIYQRTQRPESRPYLRVYAMDLPVFDNLYEQTADFTKIQTSDLSQKGRFGATSSGNATRVQSQYEYRYCAGTPTRNTKPPGALELGCPSLLPNGQTLGQGIRILYELPSTIAPHCPGHHSTGFPAIPDKIL